MSIPECGYSGSLSSLGSSSNRSQCSLARMSLPLTFGSPFGSCRDCSSSRHRHSGRRRLTSLARDYNLWIRCPGLLISWLSRFLIPFLRTAPEPMSFAPCRTLALLPAIFGFSAPSALGKFTRISFPAATKHVRTLTNTSPTIVFPTSIPHDDTRPILNLRRQPRWWVR